MDGRFCGSVGLGHVGVIIYGGEEVCDGAGMVVGGGFKSSFGSGEGLWCDRAVGVIEFSNDLRDGADENAGGVVDEVGKDVGVQGSVDLLDECPFNEVSVIKNC